MAETSGEFDDVVIGAGASGLWAAIELSQDRDVLVVEAGSVGSGASGAAAGFVSAFEDWARFPKAVSYAIQKFRSLDGLNGFRFHDRPYIQLAESLSEAESLKEAYAPLREREGYEISYLGTDEVLDRWPGILDLSKFTGALVNEESGIVDAQTYLDALAALARDRGVEILTDTPVESIQVTGNSVTGIATEDGVISADTVVCAAGAQTAHLVDPFVTFPTRRFIYCSLHVEYNGPVSDDYPMVYGNGLWWRPEPDKPATLLVSGGMYFIPDNVELPDKPPAEYLDEINAQLPQMAKGVRPDSIIDGSFHTCTGGSSITPDALPVLDAPTTAPDGLIVATGVTAGISMSPFTGKAVRSLVTGEQPPIPLDPFRADRFKPQDESFQVHGIREMD